MLTEFLKQKAVLHWEAVENHKLAECCKGASKDFAELGTALVTEAGARWYQGTSADWWLLETSGLPYGLTGDMIGACPPNRWLGMVFGASTLDLSDLVFSPR